MEWHGGIIAIGGVQEIVGVVPVGGIEGIVGRVAIRRIDGVAGIKAVGRVEGIIRREGLRGIQRIVRRILTGRIEDIVVALALLGEALLGSPPTLSTLVSALPLRPTSGAREKTPGTFSSLRRFYESTPDVRPGARPVSGRGRG
ncbi:MAG: hypothetical protein AAB433_14110 [Nitrospirota bacterium]